MESEIYSVAAISSLVLPLQIWQRISHSRRDKPYFSDTAASCSGPVSSPSEAVSVDTESLGIDRKRHRNRAAILTAADRSPGTGETNTRKAAAI